MMPDRRAASRLACRLLLDADSPRLPVDLMRIAALLHKTRVFTYKQGCAMSEMSLDAFRDLFGNDAFTTRRIVHGTICTMIFYDDETGNPGRERFNVAHEIGHVSLGHRLNNAREEAEADAFAGTLLCPPPVIQGMNRPTVAEIMIRFGVSRQCAQVALSRLGTHATIDAETKHRIAMLYVGSNVCFRPAPEPSYENAEAYMRRTYEEIRMVSDKILSFGPDRYNDPAFIDWMNDRVLEAMENRRLEPDD